MISGFVSMGIETTSEIARSDIAMILDQKTSIYVKTC